MVELLADHERVAVQTAVHALVIDRGLLEILHTLLELAVDRVARRQGEK
jgi:hypothetical protein